VLKGVLSREDAAEAVRRGVDAVYVSNHGGRQLDTCAATLDVLPEIADAVNDRVEILVDGGIRRGEDAVKACALGARACLIGRPWVFALAAGGEPAVERMLELLQVDVARTLALLGVPRLADVTGDVLRQPRFAPASPPGPGDVGR
jgi:isopentenyl diphosphate isomerase/L-lactate dehydrogenase-like FMN-dependent dehydrogenase